jgi:hypothetical protein
MVEATGENPTHLNNHHLDTLSAIYSHPVSHNIRWVDVLNLLEAAGTAEEKHDGKFTVTLGEETEVLERPHNKDIDTQMVVDLRRMLKNAGFEPRSKGQEI